MRWTRLPLEFPGQEFGNAKREGCVGFAAVKVLLSICVAMSTLRSAGQDSTIRTTVPLVVLPTSVTEKGGGVISGLTASDFMLLDDGKPKNVNIDFVDLGLAPIALVVLIQTNDLSSPALGKISKSAP
jgi:hypothetical protein